MDAEMNSHENCITILIHDIKFHNTPVDKREYEDSP